MKSLRILKSTLVELNFCYDETNLTGHFSVDSSRSKTFSTRDCNEALQAYQSEIARLRAESLKALEEKAPKPIQNVIGKHRGRLG